MMTYNLKHNTGAMVHAANEHRQPLCGARKRAGRRQAAGWLATDEPVNCGACLMRAKTADVITGRKG